MGIYIEGMEIPKFLLGGQITEIFPVQGSITVYPNGEAKLDILLDKHRETHKLIPVPPHGDLIDKSGVEVLSWYKKDEGDFEDGVLFVLDKLDELPIIIPAEEDEE